MATSKQPQWEYRVCAIPDWKATDLLNACGRDGWEMVSVVVVCGATILGYFKRLVPEK